MKYISHNCNFKHDSNFQQVVSFNPVTSKYEVDDIDEEGKECHTLSKRRVVPLPQWRANPDTDADAIYATGTVKTSYLL